MKPPTSFGEGREQMERMNPDAVLQLMRDKFPAFYERLLQVAGSLELLETKMKPIIGRMMFWAEGRSLKELQEQIRPVLDRVIENNPMMRSVSNVIEQIRGRIENATMNIGENITSTIGRLEALVNSFTRLAHPKTLAALIALTPQDAERVMSQAGDLGTTSIRNLEWVSVLFLLFIVVVMIGGAVLALGARNKSNRHNQVEHEVVLDVDEAYRKKKRGGKFK